MKALFSFLLLMINVSIVSAQSASPFIEEIRAQFKWINNQHDFDTIALYADEFTDETPDDGAELKGFYKGDTLHKITEIYGVSFAQYRTEYYFKDNELIFVYYTEESFMEEANLPKYEERVYYHRHEIIRHLKKNSPLSGMTRDFQKDLQDLRPMLDARRRYAKRYVLLEGLWKNADNEEDWFESQGVRGNWFSGSDYKFSFRILMGERYFFLHNLDKNEDIKYELLNLNADSLEIQNRLTGEYLLFEKNRD